MFKEACSYKSWVLTYKKIHFFNKLYLKIGISFPPYPKNKLTIVVNLVTCFGICLNNKNKIKNNLLQPEDGMVPEIFHYITYMFFCDTMEVRYPFLSIFPSKMSSVRLSIFLFI